VRRLSRRTNTASPLLQFDKRPETGIIETTSGRAEPAAKTTIGRSRSGRPWRTGPVPGRERGPWLQAPAAPPTEGRPGVGRPNRPAGNCRGDPCGRPMGINLSPTVNRHAARPPPRRRPRRRSRRGRRADWAKPPRGRGLRAVLSPEGALQHQPDALASGGKAPANPGGP